VASFLRCKIRIVFRTWFPIVAVVAAPPWVPAAESGAQLQPTSAASVAGYSLRDVIEAYDSGGLSMLCALDKDRSSPHGWSSRLFREYLLVRFRDAPGIEEDMRTTVRRERESRSQESTGAGKCKPMASLSHVAPLQGASERDCKSRERVKARKTQRNGVCLPYIP
jgi:hypothetical protein